MTDGHDYAEQALEKGAVAIIAEKELEETYDRERLRQLGDILTANIHKMEKGMTKVLVEDLSVVVARNSIFPNLPILASTGRNVLDLQNSLFVPAFLVNGLAIQRCEKPRALRLVQDVKGMVEDD